MNRFRTHFVTFAQDREGNVAEYAVILGLILGVAFAGINQVFEEDGNVLDIVLTAIEG